MKGDGDICQLCVGSGQVYQGGEWLHCEPCRGYGSLPRRNDEAVPRRLLLVEPSPLLARALTRWLAGRGWAVHVVSSSESALWLLGNAHFDAALCTWRHVDAASVLAECDRRRVPAAVLSGAPPVPAFASRWLAKPDLDALRAWLSGVKEAA